MYFQASYTGHACIPIVLVIMSPPSLFTGQKGDCTISMKEGDFMDMVSGKLSGQKVLYSEN